MTEAEQRMEEVARALEASATEQRRQCVPADYVYDKSQEAFWDLEDMTMHAAESVDASIPEEHWREVAGQDADPEPEEGQARPRGRPRRARPPRRIPPSKDIRRIESDQFIEGTTWWPGEPKIIRDKFINSDGFFPAPGRRILNLYRPGPDIAAKAKSAKRWIDLVKKVYPDPIEHEYFLDYCAHMVQRPHEKCNAAVMLSGAQRIGKDVLLNVVRDCIGRWNSKNIDPDHLFGGYNPWAQTVMLVIDEARPSKDDFRATSMYNILKPYIAAPPDTLPVNDKYVKMRHIVNVMRVFITTNDWLAMYIPAGDQRMFVMNSPLDTLWYMEKEPTFFVEFDKWRTSGGTEAVAAYLQGRDLSAFNPKGAVPKTSSWGEIAASWEDGDDAVSLILEELGMPDVVLGCEFTSSKAAEFDHKEEIAGLIRKPRSLAHRMTKAGYISVPPPPGNVRWSLSEEGRKVQTKAAFVRRSLGTDAADLSKLVRARMQLILDNGGKSLSEKGKVVPIKQAAGF